MVEVGRLYTPGSMRVVRAAVVGVGVTTALAGLGAGCSSTSAYSRFTSQMKTICVKAGAPTSQVAAVPAGAAVAELQVAHMTTAPWDRLSPSDLIIECGTGQAGSGTVFLDACGRHTPAPPTPTTAPCPTDATCAPLEATINPPYRIVGC
jgi:hypothetical protein